MEYGRFMEYGSDENLCHRYALQCNEKIMEIMDMHNSTRWSKTFLISINI